MVNSTTSERCKKFIEQNSDIIECWEKGTDPFKKAIAATLKETVRGR
ncbi:hypothetical protein SDC9_95595 [bioreactor metagenome]|uniref:Uncharacterized protein n=1 Tax=bioreactor metagenome TaxID=1076179 RepID=A0A645A844_9ZZZZ